MQLIGRLSLNPNTTIVKGKTKKNNYQFQVTTAKGMYILRVSSALCRVGGPNLAGMLAHVRLSKTLACKVIFMYSYAIFQDCQLHAL